MNPYPSHYLTEYPPSEAVLSPAPDSDPDSNFDSGTVDSALRPHPDSETVDHETADFDSDARPDSRTVDSCSHFDLEKIAPCSRSDSGIAL